MEPALDAGVEKSAIYALTLWIGSLLISAFVGLSQSHQPSLASREGMGIFEDSSPVCGTDYAKRLCNCLVGRLQEFRIFMQFPCRRASALAPGKQV
jgi:hypothetical protein